MSRGKVIQPNTFNWMKVKLLHSGSLWDCKCLFRSAILSAFLSVLPCPVRMGMKSKKFCFWFSNELCITWFAYQQICNVDNVWLCRLKCFRSKIKSHFCLQNSSSSIVNPCNIFNEKPQRIAHGSGDSSWKTLITLKSQFGKHAAKWPFIIYRNRIVYLWCNSWLSTLFSGGQPWIAPAASANCHSPKVHDPAAHVEW